MLADHVAHASGSEGATSSGMSAFLLSGTRGCGKRTLSSALAMAAFEGGDASRALRLNMSQFAGSDGVVRLVGPPPGMHGHGLGGVLTQQLRRHRHFLLILDNIDRAHATVQVRHTAIVLVKMKLSLVETLLSKKIYIF